MPRRATRVSRVRWVEPLAPGSAGSNVLYWLVSMFLESFEHEEHHYCHDAGADQDGRTHARSCHVIAISRVLILLIVELKGLLNLDWRIYRNIANSFQDKNKFVGASICD